MKTRRISTLHAWARWRARTLVACALTAASVLSLQSAQAATFDPATATIAAIQCLPTIIVPGGFFASDGMPFGVQFLGKPFSEPPWIKIASGYEAVSKNRKGGFQ